MAAIGSVEYFNDAEMGEKCVTEMKPYSVYGGIGSDRREVYVILPVGVKYNPGVTRIFDNDGFIKPLPPFIDGSSGIPALASGRTITFISKIQKNNGIETYYQQAQLSLSILSKDISKKVFLNRLKQNVQVLFESENSLVTKVKTARIFSSAYDETLVKTMISGDVVVQVKITTLGRSPDDSLYQLLNKIRLLPQVRRMSSSKVKNQFLGRSF